MSTAARHLSWQPPQVVRPARHLAYRRTRSVLGLAIATGALLPVWLSGQLQIGNFSFAFAVPLILALWALTRPARPGAFARALRGVQGRGLWLETLCAVAIATLAAITTLYSPEPLNALRVILPMSYGICALILYCRISPAAARRLPFAALFAGVLSLAVGLAVAQTGAGREMVMKMYRFFGFLENPNQLGIMILGVWPLAIAMLLSARRFGSRVISVTVLLVLAASILMSGTKTALALAFASGAIMWIYHSSRSGTLATTVVRLLIALSALALAVPGTLWVLSWASPAFFARVESILTNGIWAFPSMQGRGAIWNASLEIALANPWLGAGAGTEVLGYAHSHNMLLDYFRGMGISALLIGVTLVLSALSRCASFLLSTWRKREIDRASDTVIAGMYVGAIFHLMGNQLSDSFSPTTAFMFWIMYFGAYFTANAGARAPRPRRRPSTVGWLPRAQVSLAPAS